MRKMSWSWCSFYLLPPFSSFCWAANASGGCRFICCSAYGSDLHKHKDCVLTVYVLHTLTFEVHICFHYKSWNGLSHLGLGLLPFIFEEKHCSLTTDILFIYLFLIATSCWTSLTLPRLTSVPRAGHSIITMATACKKVPQISWKSTGNDDVHISTSD